MARACRGLEGNMRIMPAAGVTRGKKSSAAVRSSAAGTVMRALQQAYTAGLEVTITTFGSSSSVTGRIVKPPGKTTGVTLRVAGVLAPGQHRPVSTQTHITFEDIKGVVRVAPAMATKKE